MLGGFGSDWGMSVGRAFGRVGILVFFGSFGVEVWFFGKRVVFE